MISAAMEAARLDSAELRELVAARARRDLSLDWQRLPRLRALATDASAGPPAETATALAGSPGNLVARFRFGPGADGFPRIWLEVHGVVSLVCQRCLAPFDWPCDLTADLGIVGSEADLAAVGEPFDTLVMGEEGLSLAELVEDEVLAAIPLAPRHADTDCAPNPASGAGDTNRPLAGLAELLGRGTGGPGDRSGDRSRDNASRRRQRPK